MASSSSSINHCASAISALTIILFSLSFLYCHAAAHVTTSDPKDVSNTSIASLKDQCSVLLPKPLCDESFKKGDYISPLNAACNMGVVEAEYLNKHLFDWIVNKNPSLYPNLQSCMDLAGKNLMTLFTSGMLITRQNRTDKAPYKYLNDLFHEADHVHLQCHGNLVNTKLNENKSLLTRLHKIYDVADFAHKLCDQLQK